MRKSASQIADEVLLKTAGYWQNVVGFDDPKQLSALRQAARAGRAAEEKWYEDAAKYEESKLGPYQSRWVTKERPRSFWDIVTFKKPRKITEENPEYEAYQARAEPIREEFRGMHPFPDEAWRVSKREALRRLGGTDLGYLAKYYEIPGMQPWDKTSILGSRTTGRGYVDRETLLQELERDPGMSLVPGEIGQQLLEAIKASPHKYFTSTEYG